MSSSTVDSTVQKKLLKKLKNLSSVVFENIIYDLLTKLGVQNCTWRTPGSDVGRDIEGEYDFIDISGHWQSQKWYIECKRYNGSVDWPTIWNKVAYAEAQRADVLLIASTGTPTTQALDQIQKWNDKRGRLILRFWPIHKLLGLLFNYPEILLRYQLIPSSVPLNYKIIYPLSMACLKYAQAAEAMLAFKGQCNPPLIAAAALADLINKKIDSKSNTRISHIRKEDVYDWIDISNLNSLKGFDRYGWRSFVSSIHCINKLDRTVLRPSTKGFEVHLVHLLTPNQFEDLLESGEWTRGECVIYKRTIRLNRRLKHE